MRLNLCALCDEFEIVVWSCWMNEWMKIDGWMCVQIEWIHIHKHGTTKTNTCAERERKRMDKRESERAINSNWERYSLPLFAIVCVWARNTIQVDTHSTPLYWSMCNLVRFCGRFSRSMVCLWIPKKSLIHTLSLLTSTFIRILLAHSLRKNKLKIFAYGRKARLRHETLV